jgi:hypothetical protein
MNDVDQCLRQAREKAADDRRAAIVELQQLAHDASKRDEAVDALVHLWREHFAAPADVALFATTVLESWKRLYPRVKAFQQPVAKVEWIMDDEYAEVSREAETLLGLLGYFHDEAITPHLREALQQLSDPDLKMFAILSLVRRGDPVSAEEIEPVAASHLVRIYLWDQLLDLGMESLMPEEWAAPEELAASELSRWLSHPNELNAFPEEIELMGIYSLPPEGSEEGPDENFVYLFRFREYPKPWEPGEGWMAGIAGSYRDGRSLRSPWSQFRRWDSMSADAHVSMLYYRCSSQCETDKR